MVPIAAAFAPCCKSSAHRLFAPGDLAAKALPAGSIDANEMSNMTL
jgi:hypothetical protein